MTDETALGAELRRTGYDSNEMRFLSALSLYLNNGGTIPRAQKLVEIAAAKLPGEGHPFAAQCRLSAADAWQQNDGGEGRSSNASSQPLAASSAVAEREGEAKVALPQGSMQSANPSPPIANGKGLLSSARDGQTTNARPARETVSEAGRVLQSVRKPGAGALQARAYETQARIRGESWLLSYNVPDGPAVLELAWGDVMPMAKRMEREGTTRVFAAILLRRLHSEGEALGKINPAQVIGKTLPPSVIARVAKELEPQALAARVKKSLHGVTIEQLEAAHG